MKTRVSKNFHMSLNNLSSVKTAKSSLARGHMGGGWGGGGGDYGYLELGPKTPPWVRGSIYKKKVLRDPGPNTHIAATISKEVLGECLPGARPARYLSLNYPNFSPRFTL